MLITKKTGRSKVLSRGYCLFASEAEEKALLFSGIFGFNETITTQLLNQINKIRETEV